MPPTKTSISTPISTGKRSEGVRIDISPLSVNKAWQGKRFKTDDYKQFEKDMLRLLPKKKTIPGRIKVDLTFYLKPTSFSLSDIDNFLKPILDCLVKREYFTDDRYIEELACRKIKSTSNAIEIKIDEL